MVTSKTDQIIDDLKAKGRKSNSLEQVIDLVQTLPSEIEGLLHRVLAELPEGGTYFDAALSFVDERAWPGLVALAVEQFEFDHHRAAESVIDRAGWQVPSALQPHRERLFNRTKFHFRHTLEWRDCGAAGLRFLLERLEDPSADVSRRAWECLFGTRDPRGIRAALAHIPAGMKMTVTVGVGVEHYLREVGFDLVSDRLRRLNPGPACHLLFPKGHPQPVGTPIWQTTHPTWTASSPSARLHRFGGEGKATCRLCRKRGHHLITLDPVPPGLRVTGLERLSLEVCLSCLGWERGATELFYRHDRSGTPSSYGPAPAIVVPQFPAVALEEFQVSVEELGPRWAFQGWGVTNSRENLHRAGGEPSWVQGADYPACPKCRRTMRFLLQLDSNLPTLGGGEWLWGSGGMGYAFWCNGCRISGFLWQCT